MLINNKTSKLAKLHVAIRMEHEKQTRECSKQNEFQQQQTRHEVHVNISTHRKTAKILEVAALTVALTATVTLFSLPIIFHFVIVSHSTRSL